MASSPPRLPLPGLSGMETVAIEHPAQQTGKYPSGNLLSEISKMDQKYSAPSAYET